jgi:ribonuclease HI
LKKNPDLKSMLTEDMICNDRKKNSEIRKSIWSHYANDLMLDDIEIELSKFEERDSWDKLKNYLPMYVLFQSDRKNSDGDSEIQNPMKIAVQEILKDSQISSKLSDVAYEVKRKLEEVSKNTLEKLNEMNPDIARTLEPVLPSVESLKWVDVFKSVSINCDDSIPINKRGSGVKRLVLLNFFRAEAERKLKESITPDVIYAIEEPETSQHPNHQMKLIEAFIDLSKSGNTQILLTTHSPSIVKMLKFENIKLIIKNEHKEVVDVKEKDLPYPSLNEVNYLAFSESNDEYHNELYGYIESENWLNNFKIGKSTRIYKKIKKDGSISDENIILSEFIRHQIHHPENTNNPKYTNDELQASIDQMRKFIKGQSSSIVT